ncbi:unnamed protein product, partial [Didymodactylos carnosus]
QGINLSDEILTQLYDENKIHDGDNIEKCLKRLCEFLNQIFDKDKRLFKNLSSTANNENQQYLVKLSKKILNHNDTNIKKIENDFDMETCCILLSIFNNRLPSFYQILWCTIATEDDIKLFYSRIRTFTNLIFVVIDIDKIHHRLRELILNEQDQLSKLQTQHATVYYFSRELTLRRGMKPFIIAPKHKNPHIIQTQLKNLQNNSVQPQIQIIYGKAGIAYFETKSWKYF